MALSDNGKTSRYSHNVAGERIRKSYSNLENVYINGRNTGHIKIEGEKDNEI